MDIRLTGLDWLVFISATVGSIALGLFLSRKMHAGDSSANFFLAGRKMAWPIIGASFFATNIGAQHLVGLSGDAYRYGISVGTIELTGIFSLGFAAAYIFPLYIRNGVFTIPQFLEIRYNTSARLLFSGFMLFMAIFQRMALDLFAGSLVIRGILGWDLMTTVIIIGVAGAIITIIGGFAAVSYTDTIQTTIIIVGCSIMFFVGLDKVGGWSALAARVPEAMHVGKAYDDPNFPFWGIMMLGMYAGIFYWGFDQTMVQRALGAKDLRHARWGSLFAVLLKLTPIFIFSVPGVMALALFPGRDPKLTFITLLNDLLPTGLRGLVLAALLASILSVLDGTMNSISTLAVRDFVLHFRPRTTEHSQIFLGRLAIVVATILGVGAAYLVYRTPGGIFKYFQALGAILYGPLIPTMLFGVFSKRVTLKGAAASTIVGGIMAAIFLTDELMPVKSAEKVFPWLHTTLTLNYTYRGILGFLSASAVLFIVSGFTQKTAPERLEKTTVDWKKKGEPFEGLWDWRLQSFALLVLTVLICVWLW